MTSLYYCITTFTTIGYGDIHAWNYIEMCFSIVFEITAAIGFTYLTSILASLVQS